MSNNDKKTRFNDKKCPTLKSFFSGGLEIGNWTLYIIKKSKNYYNLYKKNKLFL